MLFSSHARSSGYVHELRRRFRVAPGRAAVAGLTVVELAVGASDLGLGLAGGLPGKLLADLGASVVRIVAAQSPPIDADVPWGRAWHRDKKVAATDDRDEAFAVLREADVVLAYGPEELVEERGLGYRDVSAVNPAVVYARCRPSRAGGGPWPTSACWSRPGPGSAPSWRGTGRGRSSSTCGRQRMGTAALLTSSVLGLLCRRAATGRGGWAETSLYDGMLATLGCMIGRSERAAPHIEGYWEKGSTFPNFLYRCADGELLQVWFGGKGMYDKLISVLGDEPSTEGYYSDQTHRQARRAGQALGIVLRHQAAGRVDHAAARGGGRLRAGARPGRDPRRPAPGGNRAGRPVLRRAARRRRGRLADLGPPHLKLTTPVVRRPAGGTRRGRREASFRSGKSWFAFRVAGG